MQEHRRQRCGAVDSRLLREMTDAALELKLSQPTNRLLAIHRYLVALHRFTDRVLRLLESPR